MSQKSTKDKPTVSRESESLIMISGDTVVSQKGYQEQAECQNVYQEQIESQPRVRKVTKNKLRVRKSNKNDPRVSREVRKCTQEKSQLKFI